MVWAIIFQLIFNQLKIKYEPILHTIRIMESSNGHNCKRRFEPNFLERYRNQGIMPALIDKFGETDAASSYGCYQIMICSAYDQGFRGTPEELENPFTNELMAIIIVNKWYQRYDGDVWKIFKRYNGSSVYADRAYIIYKKY